jgi:ethanolamine ammonia-lyase large subunit
MRWLAEMFFTTLLIESDSPDDLVKYVKSLRKKEDSIVSVKKVRRDEKADKTLGISAPTSNVLVEIKHTSSVQDIRHQIVDNNLVTSVDVVGPYEYVK